MGVVLTVIITRTNYTFSLDVKPFILSLLKWKKMWFCFAKAPERCFPLFQESASANKKFDPIIYALKDITRPSKSYVHLLT